MLTIRSDDMSGAFSDYRKAIADEILARAQLEQKTAYGFILAGATALGISLAAGGADSYIVGSLETKKREDEPLLGSNQVRLPATRSVSFLRKVFADKPER